jgi:hypothetical protein
MSTTMAPAKTVETTTVKTAKVPTWAALKAQYRGAEQRGNTARGVAYDTVTRAFALTSESENGKKGTVARSARSRASEVVDGLGIDAGNVFGLSPMRIAQVVAVYAATAKAGVDPYSKEGRALFTPLDTVRKFDAEALTKAANAVKGAKPEDKAKVLSEAVDAAKKTAKERQASKKAETSTTVKVESLAQVTEVATAMLATVREASAKASEDEKAALRKALESLLAHVK